MKELDLTEHLSELRTRIIRILIYLSVGFVVAYGLGAEISEILLKPLRDVIGEHGKIVYLGILDKVLAQFQLAFWASVLLTSPLWFREMWLFIKPGLYPKEIKVIRPFIFLGFFFFLLGVLFGYFLVFPFVFQTLLEFGVTDLEAAIGVKDYLVLSTKVLIFLGVLFQLPNLMMILGFMNLVTTPYLVSIRRYVYVVFAIVSAMITPPDVITLACIWVPLIVLYEVGILAVKLFVHPYLKMKHMPPTKS